MVVVLKEASAKSKGIVMFTHKERQQIEHPSRRVRKYISGLRNNYVIGMHFGGYQANAVPDIWCIDFFMGSPNVYTVAPISKTPRIHLASRNFVPNYFDSKDRPKSPRWDIINISNGGRNKKLAEFFYVMQAVMKRRPETRILLISPIVTGKKADKELFNNYYSLFSQDQRRRFTFLPLHRDRELYPIGREDIAFLMRNSRYLTLFSEREGESRVIAEALCCGCKVIVRSYLQGGGRDFLTPENSFQFSTLQEAPDIFINALEDDTTFDSKEIIKYLRVDYTKTIFESELRSVFAHYGLRWDGQLKPLELDQALPGHSKLLDERYRSGMTDDLVKESKMYSFLKDVYFEKTI